MNRPTSHLIRASERRQRVAAIIESYKAQGMAAFAERPETLREARNQVMAT